MMNNVLLDELPTEWNGYQVNIWYQIGIQIMMVQSDNELSDREKIETIIQLLFGDEDGSLRDCPHSTEEVTECINWFINGWYHDNKVSSPAMPKVMDYDIDQWRIYADFLQIYRVDLAESNMHWWMFQGLLWNMPHEQSSFMQCLEIRTKKPRKGASAEERKAIEAGHKRYDIKEEKVLSDEDKKKIDEFDALVEQQRKEKIKEDALKEFSKQS